MPPLRFKPSGKYTPSRRPKSKTTEKKKSPDSPDETPKSPGGETPKTALQETGAWLGDNWGKVATGGLFAWMMLDDGSDEKIGGAFGKIGEVLSGAFGGLLGGLMPLLLSSSSLACVVFMFVSMFAAIQSQ
jgi:hypothetical protein